MPFLVMVEEDFQAAGDFTPAVRRIYKERVLFVQRATIADLIQDGKGEVHNSLPPFLKDKNEPFTYRVEEITDEEAVIARGRIKAERDKLETIEGVLD